MKSLNELKTWFKAVHQHHISDPDDQKYTARYRMMIEMLDYIYPEFNNNNISGNWIQESLNEYYGGITK